jgi:hypothetical protein
LKAVHDRKHHDQSGHAQRNARHRQGRNEGDEGIATRGVTTTPGIAQTDVEFEGKRHRPQPKSEVGKLIIGPRNASLIKVMNPPLPSLLILAGALPDAGWLSADLRGQAAALPAWHRFASRARLIEAAIETVGPVPEPGHLRFLAQRHGLARASAWPAFELAQTLQASPAHRPGQGVAASDDRPLWCLQPVHFLLGRDHIRLMDPRALALDLQESQDLQQAVAWVFEEEGLVLGLHSPGLWWVQARTHESQLQIQTFSAAGTIGRSIEARLPAGAHARRWRRLLNECQMIWHAHPINEARQTRGQLAVNGLWIEGPSHDPGLPVSISSHAIGMTQTSRGEPPRIDPPYAEIPHVETRLLEAQSTGDPQAWLEAWQEVCETHLGGQADRFAQIVLAGDCGWRLLASGRRTGWASRISAWLARVKPRTHEQWLIPGLPHE